MKYGEDQLEMHKYELNIVMKDENMEQYHDKLMDHKKILNISSSNLKNKYWE